MPRMEGLPEGVRWVWVSSFTPRSYAQWVPTTAELEQLDRDYQTAMELVVRFSENPHQASYAAMLRDKLSKEQEQLIYDVLDYQLVEGYISNEQHSQGKMYNPYERS